MSPYGNWLLVFDLLAAGSVGLLGRMVLLVVGSAVMAVSVSS